MTEFLMNYGMLKIMAGICLAELLVKWLLGHTWKRLLKAAENMSQSKHRLMKNICMRFETCYKLQIGVPNVAVFVERYLRRYRILGLYSKTWEAFCNQCMLLTMVIGMGSGIWALWMDVDPKMIFLHMFAGVLSSGILFVFDYVFGIHNKQELLQIEIMDFLENIYKPRLENETFYPEKIEEYQKEYFEKEDRERKVVNFTPKMPEIEFTEEEEAVIREVIHEYMG